MAYSNASRRRARRVSNGLPKRHERDSERLHLRLDVEARQCGEFVHRTIVIRKIVDAWPSFRRRMKIELAGSSREPIKELQDARFDHRAAVIQSEDMIVYGQTRLDCAPAQELRLSEKKIQEERRSRNRSDVAR